MRRTQPDRPDRAPQPAAEDAALEYRPRRDPACRGLRRLAGRERDHRDADRRAAARAADHPAPRVGRVARRAAGGARARRVRGLRRTRHDAARACDRRVSVQPRLSERARARHRGDHRSAARQPVSGHDDRARHAVHRARPDHLRRSVQPDRARKRVVPRLHAAADERAAAARHDRRHARRRPRSGFPRREQCARRADQSRVGRVQEPLPRRRGSARAASGAGAARRQSQAEVHLVRRRLSAALFQVPDDRRGVGPLGPARSAFRVQPELVAGRFPRIGAGRRADGRIGRTRTVLKSATSKGEYEWRRFWWSTIRARCATKSRASCAITGSTSRRRSTARTASRS
ncbi:hypothetical protein BDAG_03090 [Burkholderia dolosa AU0158]|nr:hypothetical protein BDAG_03090 [Burkholderia dolosa AU0158]